MCQMYDYEEYHEPTIADEIMGEASEKLKEALKESVKAYYDSIIKENEDLKAKNAELEKFVDEIDAIRLNISRERSELASNVKRMRLSELMKDFEVELYRVDYEYILKEKCEACNDNRKVAFLSPSGKELFEPCSCNENIGKHYFVKPYYCCEFSNKNHDSKLKAFYRVNRFDTNNEYYSYDSSTYCAKVLEKGFSDFENFDHNLNRETFFRYKEDAQNYCDYLNQPKEDKQCVK
jgi:hypothetical protein